MDDLITAIAKGGPGVPWILVAYLLWRVHNLTDKQNEANLKTAQVLSSMRTLLAMHFRLPVGEEAE